MNANLILAVIAYAVIRYQDLARRAHHEFTPQDALAAILTFAAVGIAVNSYLGGYSQYELGVAQLIEARRQTHIALFGPDKAMPTDDELLFWNEVESTRHAGWWPTGFPSPRRFFELYVRPDSR